MTGLLQIKQSICLLKMGLRKLKTFDSSYFKGKNHFEGDGTQNYLVFQSMCRYFKRIAVVGSGSYRYFWKSKVYLMKGLILILHLITVLLQN